MLHGVALSITHCSASGSADHYLAVELGGLVVGATYVTSRVLGCCLCTHALPNLTACKTFLLLYGAATGLML